MALFREVILANVIYAINIMKTIKKMHKIILKY